MNYIIECIDKETGKSKYCKFADNGVPVILNEINLSGMCICNKTLAEEYRHKINIMFPDKYITIIHERDNSGDCAVESFKELTDEITLFAQAHNFDTTDLIALLNLVQHGMNDAYTKAMQDYY